MSRWSRKSKEEKLRILDEQRKQEELGRKNIKKMTNLFSQGKMKNEEE